MPDEKVTEWSLDGVLAELSTIHGTMRDRQFAFILGAGASFTSGIPTGRVLAERWLRDLHLRECTDGAEFAAWISTAWPDATGLTLSSAAEHYPEIFERRFASDKEAGYAELESAMEGKVPSLGYSLLAEIIQHTRHKVVVTTNFDNLVADALAMHAHQSPLIVAHESLAGFVRPRLRRPLVAKIHRDLFLHPRNDVDGVSNMDDAWKAALKKLFQYFTPIVIGYGGNDGSLMNLLEGLDPGDIAGRMFWCYRDGAPPSAKAQRVLIKHHGVMVKIVGFDEFLMVLAERLIDNFDVSAIADRTEELGKSRATRYRTQTEALLRSSAKGTIEEQRAGKVIEKSAQRKNSWWDWELAARGAPDIARRDATYKAGIEEYPTSSELIGGYADFLADQQADFDGAEARYRRALELDPHNAITTGNYAVFLATQRKDPDGAEVYYKLALELDPGHAGITGNYANFLADRRNDFEAAEVLYKRALELDPRNAINAGNYANFLADQRKDLDAAEAFYKRALELDPGHAGITGNYATFLAEQRAEIDVAEAHFKRALELDPRNVRVAGRYAVFLANHRADLDAAEALFRLALELDPRNADTCANYASLLLSRGNPDSLATARRLVLDVLRISSRAPSQAVAEALLYGALYQELVPESADESMLNRLKGLFALDYQRGSWDFEPMLRAVLPKVSPERKGLYTMIAAAILDPTKVAALDAAAAWQMLTPIDPFSPIGQP